jgi:signal transduction histidine kinase
LYFSQLKTRLTLLPPGPGRGFEPEEASNGPGLGVTSIRERMAIVNGQLSIDAKLKRGTTVQALVPINYKKKSASASK